MWLIVFLLCGFFGILSFVVDLNSIFFDGLNFLGGEIDFVIGFKFFYGFKIVFL